MKKIIQYECEICCRRYNTEEEAIQCESEGVEAPLIKVGQCVSFKDYWNEEDKPTLIKCCIIAIEKRGHMIKYNLGDEDKRQYNSILGNEDFKDLCTIVKK